MFLDMRTMESEVMDMNTYEKRRRSTTRTRVRVRVKSRIRFITFLVLVIGLFAGTIGFATGLNDSTASVTSDYTSYTVVSGDTLWDIADQISCGSTDTRKVVHAICRLNDIQAEELQPGMVLTIPADF